MWWTRIRRVATLVLRKVFRPSSNQGFIMQIDEGADTPFEGNRFFVNEFWFLLDLHASKAGDRLHAHGIHEIQNVNDRREVFRYIPLFTNRDLAFHAAESLQKLGIKVVPFQMENLDQLEETFEALQSIGRLLVGFDPKEKRVETLPIDNVLEAIRRKKLHR
jgi:hypothetical protein